MTTELYVQCFIACLIGNILHILVKIRSLYVDHKALNLEFSTGQYLKEDKWALIVDIFASFALVYLIDEFLDMDSRLIGKIKTIFVFVGFSGSYVILQLMSVAKRNFRNAAGYKAKEQDTATGNADKPTPTK